MLVIYPTIDIDSSYLTNICNHDISNNLRDVRYLQSLQTTIDG